MQLNDEMYQKAVADCECQMASIASFDGLIIERRGVWVWVTGNTKNHCKVIKGAGFKYAPKKQAWYWHPDYVPANNKHAASSLDYIRRKWAEDTTVYHTDYGVVS